ncbi:MAG: radical SAM protein [Syntrophomonadaceae bacterium]|jgi:pyrroloquinoline quinone biosynthesis protein E|nr:radical SAM protein [Syntrophomonadaceae bacterium]
MKIRSEYHKILFSANGRVMEINSRDYNRLYEALGGADNGIRREIRTLKTDIDEQMVRKIKNAAEESMTLLPNPRDSLRFPLHMNFELTSKCPLRCPQCYCSLENGKELDFERAREVLRDGAENGLWEVNLSGGETMLYPRLYNLIEECSKLGVSSNIAISGYGVDKTVLNRLIEAGTNAIFISLNGSTEEINSHTRDGYSYALNALALLCKADFPKTTVNFVAHNTNCDDFPNMVSLCEEYGVSRLVVMAAKPTSKYELNTVPSAEQTARLAENIQKARSRVKVSIGVENCYSPLRAYLGKSFLRGNNNSGIWRGCSAGRYMMSLDVDGNFTPCRHLLFVERFKTIGEYWHHSEVLNKIRNIEDSPGQPCGGCELGRYCLSCLAVNYKIEGKLEKRNKHCPVAEFTRAAG